MTLRTLAIALAATAALTGALGAAQAQTSTSSPTQAPSGDDAHAKRLFLRCASCHALSDTGARKIGPSLEGIVGRKVASLPGYTYSAALKAQSFVWDEALLDRWLTQPAAVVPGTSMAFAGIPNPEDRKALIAYLAKTSH